MHVHTRKQAISDDGIFAWLPGTYLTSSVGKMSDANEKTLESHNISSISSSFPEAEAAAEQANEMEKARLAVEGPGEGDLGALLAGVVDIVVMDAPRALYEPRRNLPWGPPPTTGLTVAGSGEGSWYMVARFGA